MKKLVRYLLLQTLIIASGTLISCSEGSLINESKSLSISVDSSSVSDYTATNLNLVLIGQVDSEIFVNVDQLNFYSDSECSGNLLGTSLVQDFKNLGANLNLTIQPTTEIYVQSLNVNECILLQTYNLPVLQPTAPAFANISPSSPSRVSSSPGVTGTAYPPSANIEFFSDDLCTAPLSMGSVSDFLNIGIPVTVPANITTTIYAQTVDALSTRSTCEEMTTYRFSDLYSPSPVLTSLSHPSPSNSSFTPRVFGTTAANTVSVSLYNDSGCLNQLATGTPAEFQNTGLQITAQENGTIQIYARSVDDVGDPSVCTLLTSFTHDNIAPANPSYVAANPISPTNQTTLPQISGLSTADTESLYFFDTAFCINGIGSGLKSAFETTGIPVGVKTNDTTNIFAKAFDAAGNGSSCVEMTSYTHNTFAPNPPLFQTTNPTSPTNASTTPFIIGEAADRTVQINMFNDEFCLSPIGQGSVAQYEGVGIQVTASANTSNSIYVTVSDFEGNISDCTFHAVYDHSNVAAPGPGFFMTFPASPSRTSSTPSIIGTAHSSIDQVTLYDSNTCTNVLGSGTRGQYVSSGIVVTLPNNSTNQIYGIAQDEFGNDSLCTYITDFIHNTVPPENPTYSSVSPVSPNSTSTSPQLFGNSLMNPGSQLPPINVSFFDSLSCVSKIGEGTPAEFSSTGITVNVPQNATSTIYARSFDEAGNFSACTFMLNYTHNALQPGAPVFQSSTPGSPSYSENVSLFGNYAASPDFMNRVNLSVYSDVGCTNLLASGNPSLLTTTGFPVTVPLNVTTSLYGQSTNEVGTTSSCNFLRNFRHYDQSPSNLTAVLNTDGAVNLNWFPDTTSNPVPSYNVERSTKSGGPFTTIASQLNANNYRDLLVTNNAQYFYRVFSTNSTGRSQSSSEASITVTSPAAVQAASLASFISDSRVTLTWSGFPQNMTYKVFKSTNYAGPFTDLGLNLVTTVYQDNGLTNNQTYYYRVVASNPSGESIQSNIASATPKVVPDEPTELRILPRTSLASCSGANGLALAWTASSYYTDFIVYKGTIKATSNQLTTSTKENFEECGVGTDLYYYRVASSWGPNASSPSNVVGFYSTASPNLNIFPGNNQILLSWAPPSLHTNIQSLTPMYDLYKATDPDGDYVKIAANLTTTSYTDAVTNGQGAYYYFQAHVTDGAGDKVFVGYPSSVRSATAGADPNAPSNLILTDVASESRVQLDWIPPTHYNGFRIYKASNPGGPFTQIQYVTNPFLFNAPLTPGMNYYRVTAVWGGFETAVTNTVSFRDAKISNLIATPSASEISLTWDAVLNASDYVVSRAENINGPYSDIAVELSNSHTDLTAAAGQGYYYKVKARFIDTTEGQVSAATKGMRTGSQTPSGVSLTVIGGSFINVNWPAVSGAANYQVHLATNIAGPYTLVSTTGFTSLDISGLLQNTQYFVTVTARFVSPTNSFTSSPVSARTNSKPFAPIGTLGNNQLGLTWDAQAGVTNYDLLRSSDGINFTTVTSGFASTSYTDSGVLNGNTYFYKVIANYPAESLISEISLGYSPGQAPLAPSQLRAENNNTANEISLSWTETSGKTSYNVYRSTTSGSYGAPVRSSTTNVDVRVTGLTAGVTYYFVVTAVNGTQESLVSNEVIIVPELEPVAPLAQYASPTTVNVNWSTISGASTYNLLRSEDGIFFETIATGLATTSYSDSLVNPNLTYYYKYNAEDASGAERALSQRSQPVNLSTEPQIPLGFNVTATATNSVLIEWSLVPTIQNYEILRGSLSGGPYSVISSPLSTETSFVDNSVIAGQDYFYVIRTLSYSGVPSQNSIEKSVSLVAGPPSLMLTNGANSIDLTWGSVPGASSYNVRRSLVSGGPYGIITNTSLTSFSDLSFIADKTYHYVLEAVFPDGRVSALSNEQSILRSGFLSLQVPIELTDTKLASSSLSDIAFSRATTSFNTDDYDGVVSYELEVIATNVDSVARDVSLADDGNIIVGSVSVPGNTFVPTRMKAVVTLNSGLDLYRVHLAQTTSDSDLSVYVARLLVNQVNATKTRLYYPLLTSDSTPSNSDSSVSVYSTANTTYQDFPFALTYKRKANQLQKIIEYNAWELEALVSTTGMAEGILGLYNNTTSTMLSSTETRFTTNTIAMASISIDEGVSQFRTVNEGHNYNLRIKCENNCGTGVVSVHKAGLWVKLENLAKASVIYKLNNYLSFISSQTDMIEERALIDLSQFSTSQVYFQALVEDGVSSMGSVELVHHTQDSGSVGLSIQAGSNIFVDNNAPTLVTSPALSLTSGDSYMTRVTPSTGDLTIRSSSLIIDIGN